MNRHNLAQETNMKMNRTLLLVVCAVATLAIAQAQSTGGQWVEGQNGEVTVSDPDQGQSGGTTTVSDPDQGQGSGTTVVTPAPGTGAQATSTATAKAESDINRELKQAEGQRVFYNTIVRNNVQYRTDPKFRRRIDKALEQLNKRCDILRDRVEAFGGRVETLETDVKGLKTTVGQHETAIKNHRELLKRHETWLENHEKGLKADGKTRVQPAIDAEAAKKTAGEAQGTANVALWVAIGAAILAGIALLVALLKKGGSKPAPTKSTTTPPVLKIQTVTPNQGPVAGGTTVTIQGRGVPFTGRTQVQIGGNSARVTRQTTDELDVTTPAGTVGKVSIWIGEPGTTGYTFADSFEYIP